MFRFAELPERLALPPLDAHYVSFTLAGALIERDLGRRRRPRPVPAGMSLILPAGARTPGAGTPAPTSCTSTSRRLAGARWPAAIGRAAPAPVAIRVRGSAAAIAGAGAAGRSGVRRARRALFRQALRDDRAASVARPTAPSARRPVRAGWRRRAAAGPRAGRGRARSRPVAGRPGDGGRAARAHFARSFRAATGETPYGYLRQRRVERARDLLAGPASAVRDRRADRLQLAEPPRQGVQDATGLTPAEYRRQFAAEPQHADARRGTGVPCGPRRRARDALMDVPDVEDVGRRAVLRARLRLRPGLVPDATRTARSRPRSSTPASG